MPTRTVRRVDGPLATTVTVPGSKSVANRALVCAALAGGRSVLNGVAPGDDTRAMIDGLRALGATITPSGVGGDGDIDITGVVEVDGVDGRPGTTPVSIDAVLAGTTSRFLTAVAALGSSPCTIDGRPPLRTRPMVPLHDALVELGASVTAGDRWGHLPVTVCGPIGRSSDAGAARRSLRIRGDVSSQYLTALMLIAPYLPAGLRLELTTPLVSASYLGITAQVMAAFGVGGVLLTDDAVEVPAGRYVAVEYTVEPDASSASYPLAAAAIVGGTVHVPGLTRTSLQGDARFAELLADMGCDVAVTARGTSVTREGPLRGIDVDMRDLSDLVPTLAVVAPFAHSRTTIRGVGFIRAKESDRIGDVCAELRKAGVTAEETEDGMVIEPGPPHGVSISTHHDHRLAMAFALFGLVTPGLEIEDPDVVTKSWPAYWDALDGLT